MKLAIALFTFGLSLSTLTCLASDPAIFQAGPPNQPENTSVGRWKPSSAFMTRTDFEALVSEFTSESIQINNSLRDHGKNSIELVQATQNAEISVSNGSVRFVLKFTPYTTSKDGDTWGTVDLKVFATDIAESGKLAAVRSLEVFAQRGGVFDQYMRVIDYSNDGRSMTLTRPTYQNERPFIEQARALAREMKDLQMAGSPEAYMKLTRISCLKLLN